MDMSVYAFLHTLRKNERLRLVIDLKTLLNAVWKLSEIEEDVKVPQKMVKHLKMQQVGLTNILGWNEVEIKSMFSVCLFMYIIDGSYLLGFDDHGFIIWSTCRA